MTDHKVKTHSLDRFQKAKALQMCKPDWCLFDCMKEAGGGKYPVTDLVLIVDAVTTLKPSHTRRGSLMVIDECIEKLKESI